jgi:hypothetical protein
MSGCCCNPADGAKISTWRSRIRAISAWVLPGALLALMPKCPVCVAAYVALFTGVSLSLSTATYLRWGLMLVCFVSLTFLTVRLMRRNGTFFHHKSFQEECES